ncbi:MAG: ATP-grasp domain-containing protein [Alphaproteobacteria bacterium]|nr:ATP-grasp domain-containing protein [Alphaproteobacteria bacterium]
MKKVLLISEHLLKYYEVATLQEISKTHELYLASSDNHLSDAHLDIKACFRDIFSYTHGAESLRLSSLPWNFLKDIVERLDPLNNTIKIICTSEVNMLQAARLREHFNLGRPHYDDVIVYKSKIAMKEKLRDAGILCPQYNSLDVCLSPVGIRENFENIKAAFGLPFILKPVDQSATYGVVKIYCFEDFEAAAILHAKERYEAEEFISGTLFHADSLIQSGEIVYFQTSQYLSSGLDFLSGHIHGSIPLQKDNPLFHKIYIFTQNVLKTLGWVDGSSHLEVFLQDNGELVFLEVSARPPGSLVVENYKRCFGVNILDEDLKIKLGQFYPLPQNQNQYSFWAYFPWCSGIITHFNHPALKSSFEITWFIEKGECLSPPTCILDKTAQIFAMNENYDILFEDFMSLKNFIPYQIQKK